MSQPDSIDTADDRGISPGTSKYCSSSQNKPPKCYHVVADAEECPRVSGRLVERSESYLEFHDIADNECEYCASE